MSQSNKILKYLEKGGKITPLQALNMFGSFRLSARIADLKARGIDIRKEMITQGGKRFALYYLNKHGKRTDI